MKLSFEEALDELLREGFVLFAAAQEHLHAHKDLQSASLDFSMGHALGMFDDLQWWTQKHVPLFPLGCYHERGHDSYDLYIGEDQQLYAVDSAFYWCVHKVGRHVRDGLECISAGHFHDKKELILPVRGPD